MLSSLFKNVADTAGLADLSKVEDLIKQKLACQVPVLEEICHYLFELGGKRIRPALALLVGKAFGNVGGEYRPPQTLIDLCAGIELIHMATLLHDDIIDKSSLRRHSASPYIKFGQTKTLLAGDYLLTRAYSLCARLDRFIIDATEIACVELSEGEILEAPLSQTSFTLKQALEISRKKTAALFTLAAKSAAHLARLSDEEALKIAQFGEKLGIAFQVIDDILDVSSDEKTLGKPQGADLREKKPSILNVLWLESASTLAKEVLTSAEQVSEEQIKKALIEINSSPVIAQAKKIAQDYVVESEKLLMEVVENRAKVDGEALECLQALLQYALLRAK